MDNSQQATAEERRAEYQEAYQRQHGRCALPCCRLPLQVGTHFAAYPSLIGKEGPPMIFCGHHGAAPFLEPAVHDQAAVPLLRAALQVEVGKRDWRPPVRRPIPRPPHRPRKGHLLNFLVVLAWLLLRRRKQ